MTGDAKTAAAKSGSFLFLSVLVLVLGFFLISPYGCTNASGHAEAIALAERCPDVVASLGSGLERAWGFTNYHSKSGPQRSTTSMTFPIRGSHARGRLDYSYAERGPYRGLREVFVSLPDGRSVDVLVCVGKPPPRELLTD